MKVFNLSYMPEHVQTVYQNSLWSPQSDLWALSPDYTINSLTTDDEHTCFGHFISWCKSILKIDFKRLL